MCAEIFQDAFFAAVAAVGFASISNPPRRAYPYCAFLAAVGHSLRYVLMLPAVGVHIIPAGTLAAFVVGMLAVWVTPRSKCPAETCFFPALLPMIPGVYAYRTVEAMLLCLYHSEVPLSLSVWWWVACFRCFCLRASPSEPPDGKRAYLISRYKIVSLPYGTPTIEIFRQSRRNAQFF